jgi:hypothetical protein
MITCRTATELHTRAAEGALTRVETVRYRGHMALCGPCQRYRAQLGLTQGVLRCLPEETPPDALLDRLAEVVDEVGPAR